MAKKPLFLQNAKKTKSICKQHAPYNVFLNGVCVQFSDQVKYLYVLLNASLKDDSESMTSMDKNTCYTVQQTNLETPLLSIQVQ